MRRQFPQREPPDASAARRRTGRAGGGPGVRRGAGRPRGRGRGGHRDEMPGLQGRHRDRVPRGAGRGDRRGGHDDQLRRPGAAHRGRGAGRAAAARPRCVGGPPPARGVVHRGGAHRRAAGFGRLPAAGPPGRPGPGPDGQHRAPRQRGDLPGPGHRAARAPGHRSVPVRGDRRRAGRLLRRRGRGHRGGRAEQPAASRDRHRPGRPHLLRAARRAAARPAREPGATTREIVMTSSGPPVAPRGPGADPYAWMRDRDQPQLLEYLAAERTYYDEQTASQRALREDLFAELAARLPPAEESVRWRRGGFWYFTATVAGQQLEQFCRAAGRDGPGEVLLDNNLLLTDPAAAGSYAELGVREVSPDGRYLAYSVDFDGDEVYQLRVRDLAAGTDLAERVERTYYGLAWAADSRSLLYVVTDPAYRPHEVWRHELGTAASRDSLVYREDDERFELTVRATRSGAWLLIETASRNTTETLLVPADDTGVAPFVIEPRRPGTEYSADHAGGPDGGELYLVTNAGAAEFRLVQAPVTALLTTGPGPWPAARWTEVIGAAAGTRLVRCDVFGRYLVVEQRR